MAALQMTMEAVCILKQEKPDWDTVSGEADRPCSGCARQLSAFAVPVALPHVRRPVYTQAKRVLSDTAFMCSLEEFDKDHIPDAVIAKLQRYINDPQYQPDVVAKQSRAAMSLCMWTRAMDVYNRWVAEVGVRVCVWECCRASQRPSWAVTNTHHALFRCPLNWLPGWPRRWSRSAGSWPRPRAS
jgi:hypothetical protein